MIVAFGVFLGIYANKKENQNKLLENKEKAITSIIRELENNKESLANSIKYHQLIKIEVDSVFQEIRTEHN